MNINLENYIMEKLKIKISFLDKNQKEIISSNFSLDEYNKMKEMFGVSTADECIKTMLLELNKRNK